MRKFASMSLIITAICQPLSAQERISLDCSGTLNLYEQGIRDVAINGAAVNIDLAGRFVNGPTNYTFRITQQRADSISFETVLLEKGVNTGKIMGNVNRLNGELFIGAMRDNKPNQYIMMYQLTCKSARPLF